AIRRAGVDAPGVAALCAGACGAAADERGPGCDVLRAAKRAAARSCLFAGFADMERFDGAPELSSGSAIGSIDRLAERLRVGMAYRSNGVRNSRARRLGAS